MADKGYEPRQSQVRIEGVDQILTLDDLPTGQDIACLRHELSPSIGMRMLRSGAAIVLGGAMQQNREQIRNGIAEAWRAPQGVSALRPLWRGSVELIAPEGIHIAVTHRPLGREFANWHDTQPWDLPPVNSKLPVQHIVAQPHDMGLLPIPAGQAYAGLWVPHVTLEVPRG